MKRIIIFVAAILVASGCSSGVNYGPGAEQKLYECKQDIEGGDLALKGKSWDFALKEYKSGIAKCEEITTSEGYKDTPSAKEAVDWIAKGKEGQQKAQKIMDDEAAKRKQAEAKELAEFKKTRAGKLCEKHPTWEKEDCIKVAGNKLWIGMTIEMLLAIRGAPDNKNVFELWQWK